MKEYIELNKPEIFSNCFTNTMKMKDAGSTTSRIQPPHVIMKCAIDWVIAERQ